MGREQPTRKQGRDLRVGDRLVCEDGATRVITALNPGPVPATIDVTFEDRTTDLLPAIVSFDVVPAAKTPAKDRMRVVK
jgi:hypothetical protein